MAIHLEIHNWKVLAIAAIVLAVTQVIGIIIAIAIKQSNCPVLNRWLPCGVLNGGNGRIRR